MTPDQTLSICGYRLTPGLFSSRIFTTDCVDGQLFINLKPVFYMALDGRLFMIPHGAQCDGLSAPQLAAALGREHGGNDWPAGWMHDAGYRFSLMIWDGVKWIKWDAAHGRTKQACDDLLYECGKVCGDTEAMAQTLYWAVTEFGKRSFQPEG